MKKPKPIKTPSLGVNAKSYMWGEPLLKIAQHCEEIAIQHDLTVTINVPFTEIYRIAQACPHLHINAQGVDAIEPGGKMGAVLPEMVKEAGADGVILNHAARPMTLSEVVKCIQRCKEIGLHTMVCVDNVEECRMMASLHPTGLIVEQTALIGTGIIADEAYLRSTCEAIRAIDSNIIISQGAGIKNGNDIYRNIKLGSETGGGASGIFCAEDPIAAIDDFVEGILRARKDFGGRTVE